MTTLTKTTNVLTKVGHKHEAIMQHLLEHPEQKLGEVAACFNLTQTWLSIVIHSHAFQDAFEKHREAYYGTIAEDLGPKLEGLAHLAIDKLGEQLETCNDPAWVASTADKLLGRLGFGSTGSKSNINITTGAGGSVLVQTVGGEALKRADEARRRLRQLKTIEGTVLKD